MYGLRQSQEKSNSATQEQRQRQEIAIKEALKNDMESSLQHEEEEEYNPADGDDQEEEENLTDDDYEGTSPDDSDEPSSLLDYEWSPWCEDSEFIGFADYVKEHMASLSLEDLSDEEKEQLFQNLGGNFSTPDLLEKWLSEKGEENSTKKVLSQLIWEYRFNYPPLMEPGKKESCLM